MTEKALTLLGEKKIFSVKTAVKRNEPGGYRRDFGRNAAGKPSFGIPLLPKELAAEAFAEMDKDLQEILIRHSATRNCRKFWTNCILMMRWTSLRKCPPM